MVTASKPFELTPKEWSFSFLGTFSYKGYFKQHLVLDEQAQLDREGWDTNVRSVGGWSTLGWFKDPILSNMLLRKEGDLANLIIHELTHGTIYIKDSVNFNENLASFIGDKGAEKFLLWKYGPDSQELSEYRAEKYNRKKISEHFLGGALYLDSLYGSFDASMPDEERNLPKIQAINEIVISLDTLDLMGVDSLSNSYRDLKLK